ncbi:twin-arginine translocation signal domain-containing protein [Cellulophaga omnivescoria]|uniref:twin-arginine translocation signal domain-containing protein n=1 Tax=Cellulophaga omnivescoria TaxID=1888890 RepID=UPI0022EFFF06|nr:twin-arginine translocation signal domain-containing protein [Cellulophaga omnivescoria]WBU89855.1 twin-arginine translocation signal domain-containing protein [Cellulophaga omnivescoria]
MSSRRNFIKNTALASAAVTATPSIGFSILKKSKHNQTILGHGDYTYKVHNDWAQISAVHTPLLNCHEMEMDSKGRLIMIGDHTKNNIIIFDKSGKVLDAWGTAYPGGHGLKISNEGGEDFLFIADSGWYLDKTGKWVKHNGRITKTTTDGNVIFDIGHPQTIGVYKPGENFCPTEIAIGPNGDIYVADGYGQDYILQYNYKGEFIRRWGGHNNTNKNYNLQNAHGVAIDYRDKNNPMVVCTSRNEQCFKWFTLEGKYVKTLKLPNMQVCRPVFNDANIYAGVCWSQPKVGKTNWKDHTGFVTILDGDKVVSNPGGTAPEYKNGALQKSYQLKNKPILHGHDVCVDEDKNLYICQWNANKTAPIKLERV